AHLHRRGRARPRHGAVRRPHPRLAGRPYAGRDPRRAARQSPRGRRPPARGRRAAPRGRVRRHADDLGRL
ncbi:MAG: hypothetical protein AVDCRST_MAG40-1891, partial [uncultured Gemmatimonadaceae bacterium]